MKTLAKLGIAVGVLLVSVLVIPGLRDGMSQESTRTGGETGAAAEAPEARAEDQAGDQSESQSPAQPEHSSAPTRSKSLSFNLQRPDGLIVTQSLAQLPKDIFTVPLLKDLLTEDFFYYYEQNEGGLSLRGALRRIAYEHELSIGDEVIDYVFSAPARIAFWKGRDGKLAHFMLVMDRGPIVQALELASKVVLSDMQLRLKGNTHLPAGGDLPVYDLKYAYNRSLFFTSIGGYLVVFSDAEMLLTDNGTHRASRQALLEASDPSELFLHRFDLDKIVAKHTVAVAMSYLSFGYQRFFPAIEALRFDYGKNSWTASALLSQKIPGASGLWRAAPTGAAVCAALPVAPETLTGILSRIAPSDGARTLVESVESPVTVCWYRQSRLFTPLVLAKMKEGLQIDGLLKEMFEKSIGAHEAGMAILEDEKEDEQEGTQKDELGARQGEEQEDEKGDEQEDEQGGKQEEQAGEQAQNQPGTERSSYFPPFEISEAQLPQSVTWRREVSSIHGKYDAAESPNAGQMWSKRYFTVTLSRWKDILIFSPDDALVDNAVAALDKKYPSISDLIPPKASLGLVVFPGSLGELVRGEVLESLPESQEPVFRANVTRGLMPVLDKLKSYPAYGLWTPQGSKGWELLRWQPLASR